MKSNLFEKIKKITIAAIWAIVILVPVCTAFAWCTQVEQSSTVLFIVTTGLVNLGFNGFGLWKWIKGEILPLFSKTED